MRPSILASTRLVTQQGRGGDPPSYVKAYLKRSENDANDAAAISVRWRQCHVFEFDAIVRISCVKLWRWNKD